MIPSMLMVPVMGKVMTAGAMWRWELEGEISWDNKNRKRSGATVLRVIISSFGSALPIFKDFCHVKRDRRWFIFGFFHLSWNVQLDMERKARQERESFLSPFLWCSTPPRGFTRRLWLKGGGESSDREEENHRMDHSSMRSAGLAQSSLEVSQLLTPFHTLSGGGCSLEFSLDS